MAAIDMDGTLLTASGRLPERNAAAVRAMMAAGIRVVLASGRMHCTMTPLHDHLGLDTPVISYNGAMVMDPGTGEMFHHLPMDPNVAREIVAWGAAEGRHINYYIDDRLYVERKTEWSDLYATRTKSDIIPVGPLRCFDGRSPTKLIYVGPPAETRAAMEMWRQRLGDRVYAVLSMPEYLEFLNPVANKWAGVSAVAGHYGIAPGEIVAFGDSPNDAPMLTHSGLGIVMPHAHPEVKAVADVVMNGDPEDAVARAVEALLSGKAPGAD